MLFIFYFESLNFDINDRKILSEPLRFYFNKVQYYQDILYFLYVLQFLAKSSLSVNPLKVTYKKKLLSLFCL